MAKKVDQPEGQHTFEENFEGVQVDKDEEGGGEVPNPDVNEAGKLGIIMTKHGCFAHGGEGGIAKSAQLRFPVSRERRQARPTL